jgi:hypothetical protein
VGTGRYFLRAFHVAGAGILRHAQRASFAPAGRARTSSVTPAASAAIFCNSRRYGAA